MVQQAGLLILKQKLPEQKKLLYNRFWKYYKVLKNGFRIFAYSNILVLLIGIEYLSRHNKLIRIQPYKNVNKLQKRRICIQLSDDAEVLVKY